MQEVTCEQIDKVPHGFVPILEVPGLYPDRYYCDASGTVYDCLRGRFLTQTVRKSNGYIQVALRDVENKKFLFRYCHQIVARHFVPGFDGHKVVHHKDCNKLNNNHTNLEWVTTYHNAAMGNR